MPLPPLQSRVGTPGQSARLCTIAIIGAGFAGQEFAARCLRAGIDVVLEDVMPANLRKAAHTLAPAVHAEAGTLTLARTVEDAVRAADLCIDFVPDELESKLEIFSMVDRMAPPRTILCTPTATLSITDLASCTYRPERCFALLDLPSALAAESQTPVLLSHPPATETAARLALLDLLSRLHFRVESRPDVMETQLTRPR